MSGPVLGRRASPQLMYDPFKLAPGTGTASRQFFVVGVKFIETNSETWPGLAGAGSARQTGSTLRSVAAGLVVKRRARGQGRVAKKDLVKGRYLTLGLKGTFATSEVQIGSHLFFFPRNI